jgi:hypothetical protein
VSSHVIRPPRTLGRISTRPSSRAFVLPAIGTIAGLLLAGCSGGSGDPSAVKKSVTLTSDGAQTAVLKAYSAYWDAILKASDPPDPGSSILNAHASGVELHRAVAAIKARKKAGERLRGSYGHSARVTAVVGNTATVADCLTSDVVVTTKRGDAGVPAMKAKAEPVVALLLIEGQTWKVERIDAGPASCPA